MKKIISTLFIITMILACKQKEATNPFFAEFNTPYATPPFDQIKFEHYKPAFLKGIEDQIAELKQIANNADAPTFENTVVALDKSGSLLTRVSAVFDNLTSAETTDSLEALSIELAPILAEHSDNVFLNAALFKRVNAINDQKESLSLNTEQLMLLKKYHNEFIRSGAALDTQKQNRLREINKELSTLGLTFSNNILSEQTNYQLVIEDPKELAGLPESFKESAAEEAKSAQKEGKWVITLKTSSRIPFLQYAENRQLREKLYKAYLNQCNNNDKNDNKEIIKKMVNLRLEKANLLGFDCYANFILDDNMAKNSSNVMAFLTNLWEYTLPKAKNEAALLQKLMNKEHKNETLAGWDWDFYSEKLRLQEYNLNEEELKPYFELNNVLEGAFAVCKKLYGITFTPIQNIALYHPDIKTFEVKNEDGSFIGIFYADYHPRPGKTVGAWMSEYRGQEIDGKNNIRPLICNVGNFTKPTQTTPSLLTPREVETLYHELGHGLHGLLSQCTYPGLAGTNVSRDFVELPSQIMENWVFEPEVLKMYAKHYLTGELISDQLIAKIQASSKFNQGFITAELLAAAILDMNYHNVTQTGDFDVADFENKVTAQLGLIDQIAYRYRSTYFKHIFSGGYSAGYYSYLWANVLDADAYEAFKENGIFDQKTATSFRKNILEKGGSDEPMNLYKKFRGAEPKLEPMLKNRGLI